MSDQIFRSSQNAGDPKNKDEEGLPDALKGKSKVEIVKMLQAEHISEMSKTNEDYARKLEQLALRPPAIEPPAPLAPPAPSTTTPTEPEYDPSNPDEYLNFQLNKRLGPVVQSMVVSGRETGRQLAKQKIPKEEWEKYGKEIEDFVDMVAPQMQVNPGIYDLARDFVRGKHIDEIVSERTSVGLKDAVKKTLGELGFDEDELKSRETAREESQRPPKSLFESISIPSTSTPRSAAAAQGGQPKPKLSRAELEMCEKFNMTPEDYVEYRKQNTDVISNLARERGEI